MVCAMDVDRYRDGAAKSIFSGFMNFEDEPVFHAFFP
jgi:hypothetical protein